MDTAQALSIADELQDRASHFGDRAGEGVHLGRAASAIRDLATQLDDVDGLTARIAFLIEKKRLEDEAAEEAARLAAMEAAKAEPPDPVTEDIVAPVEDVEEVATPPKRKREKLLSE